MKAPAFWWRPDGGAAAMLLAPAGLVVGAIAARRMARAPAERLAIPVLCIGNPTVGGAGKTPVAIALAKALIDMGERPVFLTRGYAGGRAGAAGPRLVAPGDASADVGDEPLLLAEVAPTVVSPDRAAGGRLAAAHGSVVVMDDGFQNPGLAKTLSALVVDAAVGLGNAKVTPAGPMRAPLRAHMGADAWLVVVGDDATQVRLPDFGTPTFKVRLAVTAPAPMVGRRVAAFAGIGRPSKFFASVERVGSVVCARRGFADHHAYSEADAARLLAWSEAHQAQPITTAKDLVRLRSGGPAARRLAETALVLTVEAVLPAPFVDMVRAALGSARA